MRRSGVTRLAGASATFFILMATLPPVQAATVGYWRFESEANFLKDSGPNGLDLSVSGTPSPTYLALPETGGGSAFDDPIPQTTQPNVGAADFRGTDASLSRADDPLFEFTDFTIEVYFNRNSLAVSPCLAAQYDSANNQRCWFFGIRRSDLGNTLTCSLSTSGSSRGFRDTTQLIASEVGHDYYAAAVYDAYDAAEGSGGEMTFYLKDLTAGTALQKETIAWMVTAPLFNSTADFTIGSDGVSPMDGIIDEVRLSNCILPESRLLVSLGPKKGDANGNGYVDNNDAAALAENWLSGPNASWEMGDFNADGYVNDVDATLLAANWTGPPETNWASAAVPEPACRLCLLIMSLGFLAYCRAARK